MICTITIGQARFDADLDAGISIAIPLDFHGAQPNAYGVADAHAEALRAGSLVGDTRLGGSCNVETLVLTPHCNGTHTECVGHLTVERIPVTDVLPGSLIPATLVSAVLVPAAASHESAAHNATSDDTLITATALRHALESQDISFGQAVIIRTLPNPESKRTRHYTRQRAPYFTVEAVQCLVERDVRHLLVDVPSLDRDDDGGEMLAHHAFWQMPVGQQRVAVGAPRLRTITEMVYIPDHVPDGRYLLNLRIAAFVSDATPSRPILYPIAPEQ